MNTKEKIEVMQAYLEGKVVQIRYGQEWIDWDSEEFGEPEWCWDSDEWRIKPKEVVKPSIDWSHVSPKYKYLAMDRGGDVYLYTHQPVRDAVDKMWTCIGGGWVSAENFASLEVSHEVEWEKSVVERPE